MEIFTTAILALATGLTVGLQIKKRKDASASPSNELPDSNLADTNNHEKPTNISVYFDILEIRFIKRLLENEHIILTVAETNEILRIEKLSKENQRQRRHLFLKDLNMKLKMIFNINECVERESTEFDRRAKIYCLSPKIDKTSLLNLINNRK